MEEYDDLSSGPNEEGIIDLSYNNWTEIPQDLYDMYRDRLKSLRMNNNKIIVNKLCPCSMQKNQAVKYTFVKIKGLE